MKSRLVFRMIFSSMPSTTVRAGRTSMLGDSVWRIASATEASSVRQSNTLALKLPRWIPMQVVAFAW